MKKEETYQEWSAPLIGMGCTHFELYLLQHEDAFQEYQYDLWLEEMAPTWDAAIAEESVAPEANDAFLLRAEQPEEEYEDITF